MAGSIYGMVTVKSSSEYTLKALDSFFKFTKLSHDDEFVLIDNDGDWLANWNFKSKLDPSKIIVNADPKNTSQNINQLMQHSLDAKKDLVFLSNDVVFTPSWAERLIQSDTTVSIPSCNQTHNYGIHSHLSIADFNNFGLLNTLSHRHNVQHPQPFERLLMPTYVCRIPYNVISVVGLFDEAYNVGGEDVDYRIRLLDAGFDLKYCSSFLLHFNGKSSWNGSETIEQTIDRDNRYRTHFKQKWGEDLFNLCIVGGNPLITINKYRLHKLAEENKYNEMILKVLNERHT